jgi:rod shape-determining protein MreD
MRVIRMGVLIVLLVIVQVAVFPHLQINGVAPDLGLVLAIAVGYQRGPESGAIVGFLSGFAFGFFLDTPLGLYALAYALVGYGVGVIEGGMMRTPVWIAPVLAFLGGLAGGLILIGIGVLAGVESVKGSQGVETVVIAALYDALLAPLVFFLVGRTWPDDDRAPAVWSGP